MTDEELIKFGKDVRKLAENPFQRQLDAARAGWKRRKLKSKTAKGFTRIRTLTFGNLNPLHFYWEYFSPFYFYSGMGL
jgi:hypothetical protein